ncbi:hypothetical protein GCM10009760_07940 [Kitasatospora kazusensis]|uniref:Uncharacterized protein n=1 Tax=Kitasatospora kazusensis TaxID=407974 RepID=A0ABN2YWV8_9ACTN
MAGFGGSVARSQSGFGAGRGPQAGWLGTRNGSAIVDCDGCGCGAAAVDGSDMSPPQRSESARLTLPEIAASPGL